MLIDPHFARDAANFFEKFRPELRKRFQAVRR
jgi:hypothetical protein